MPLNRDDIINEAPISGSSGITCNRIDIAIDPITRNLRLNFNLVKITVLADNTYFEEQQMPITLDLTDGTGTKVIDLYNRRTGLKLSGGQTRTYDLISRDLMSAFFHAYNNLPPPG